MGGKKFAVCLLALAASAGIFLRPHSQLRNTTPRSAANLLPDRSFSDAAKIFFAGSIQKTRRQETNRTKSEDRDRVENRDRAIGRSRADAGAISLPMTFEPNVGQADPRAAFVGRGKGMTVLLMDDKIFVRAGKGGELGIRFQSRGEQRETADARVADSRGAVWRGEDELASESNYFIGNDPRRWRAHVPHFARVEAPDAAAGIGVAVYGNDEGVEYDLRLGPRADVSKLRLALTGAQNVRLDSSGDLQLTVGGKEMRMKRPAVYEYEDVATRWHSKQRQRHRAIGSGGPRTHSTYKPRKLRESHRKRKRRKLQPLSVRCSPSLSQSESGGDTAAPCVGAPIQHASDRLDGHNGRRVNADYVLEADGSVGFRLGVHDAGAALVVDPSLSVSYATFLGGAGSDAAASIVADYSGKIYVGGTTTSESSFSETSGGIGPADGPAEFFIAKINPSVTGPSSLVYLTFLGGSGTQSGGLIAVDGSGDVAVMGTTTSTDFPVTDLSVPTNGLISGSGNDVTVSELDPTGAHLFFSTIFGGSGAESLNGTGGIGYDSSGDVYIASDTTTTPVDSASTDLPVTAGAYQSTWDGEPSDGFFAIFQPPSTSGGAATLKYCSYLGTGSAGAPGVGGIAVDGSGNAYIAGWASSSSGTFPSTNAIQASYGGGTSDAFLMKISPLGKSTQDLVYATLIGGSGSDQGLAVALDALTTPNAYVTGTTQSSDFPTHGATGAYQGTLHVSATANAFLVVIGQDALSGQTSLRYSTYLGGSETDAGQGIAVAAQNAVYVTGQTTSWDFPWRDNLQPFNGAGDAFIAKLDPTSAGSASLIYATPLGGTSPTSGSASAAASGIVADGSGNVYIAGATTAANFPTAVTTENPVNGFQTSCASCGQTPPASDAFVAEIAESVSPGPSVYFSVGSVPFTGAGVGLQFAGVLNGGEAPLTISAINVTGPNSGDFALTGQSACLGKSITPGPTTQCSFEVGFTPATGAFESAFVSVTDNAPGSPQILELRGLPSGPPSASISPASYDFGSQPENTSSDGQTIAFSNMGGQPLTLSAFSLGGPDAAQFSEPASTCFSGVMLASGASCTVQVLFGPKAIGVFHAELDFTDNSGNVTGSGQVVPLTGTGIASAPVANIAPTSLGFGSQIIATSSAPESVTLRNKGSAALSVGGIAVTGTNAADFAIAAGGTCAVGSGTMAIGTSCTVAVQFAPHSVGPSSASLSFTDDGPGSPQQVSLSGTGAPTPDLVASPASLSLGSQSVNSGTQDTQSMTISNQGSTSAGIGALSFSPATQTDFAVAGNTCTSLGPGAKCQITIAFQPVTVGARSATLNIPGAQPSAVGLSGTGTQAAISFPTSFAFAPQLAGSASGAQPITVTNSSSGAYAGELTVTSVSKSGANAGDFALKADTCTGMSVASQGTCAFQMVFQPAPGATCGAGGGARSATLRLTDNAPGSPHIIPLSGTATEFCLNAAAGQGISEPITAGQSATFNLEIDSSAGFTGTVQLGCTNPPTAGTCTATPASVQVGPSTPGPFQVVVTTTAASTAVVRGVTRDREPPRFDEWGVGGLGLALVLLVCVMGIAMAGIDSKVRRQPVRLVAAELAGLVLVLGMMACSGGSGAGAADPVGGTPVGTYTVMVTASVAVAGQANVVRTLPITITVQ
ncbi:MAG TPA: choice-of-anchor D domain-containing protein [Candidatus Acidoferrales bacterium]